MTCPPVRTAGADRFWHERELRARGVGRIAGVDEVGRGPLAGPVIVAAVIMPDRWLRAGIPSELAELIDSKQLTETQREHYFERLSRPGEVQFGLARMDPPEIDRLNILRATHEAMQRALDELQPAPDHALVDGLPVAALRIAQTALVKGDSLSYSIAAASVIAKVTRDRVMREFDRRWPAYGFAEHKGYGTPRHLAALATHGPCPIHRRSFAPLRLGPPELF